jgi:protoheme IX farnesyltransferase
LSEAVTQRLHPAGRGTASDYVALLKPRVMSLAIFTALAGMVAAPAAVHPWMGFMALLAIAVGAGAAGALNMWYDADIDGLMRRTAARPVPRGGVEPGEALGFGMTLAVGSVLALGLFANWTAAALLAFTIFFYVVIYTMWLKRSTPQNIVIGGAAGAFPPMIGWSAVTGTVDLASIALFLIVFLWTPPHFWALALWRRADYAKAGVPMLPVVAGPAETRKQILIYSALLLPAAMLPALLGTAGALYAVVAGLSSLILLLRAWAVYRDGEGRDNERASKRLFGFSIQYLFFVFAALIVERLFHIAPFAEVLQ